MKWTMRDGRSIDVRRMETRHIRNCISMMRRAMASDANRLNAFCQFESMLQGDMSTYYAEQQGEVLVQEVADRDAYHEAWIKLFERELERREA